MGVFQNIFKGEATEGPTHQESTPLNGEKPIDPVGDVRAFDAPSVLRKRGRPQGSKNRTDGTGGGSSAKSTTNVDPTYLVETVVMLIQIGDDVFKGAMLQRIAKWAPDKKSELQEMLEKNCLNETDQKILRSTLTHLVQKYDILAKFGPEFGLTVFAAQYAFRLINTKQFVDSLKPVDVPPKKPIVPIPRNDSPTGG